MIIYSKGQLCENSQDNKGRTQWPKPRRPGSISILGPAGLAVIMGAGDIIKPAAPNLVMLGPAFVYFASWYILGVIGFWAFGPETKGRTFEEMDSTLDQPAAAARPVAQTAGN